MKAVVAARVTGFVVTLGVGLLVLVQGGVRILMPAPPLPDRARGVQRVQPLFGTFSRTSFEVCDEYPRMSAHDELDRWAVAHGWQRVREGEEACGGSGWVSFEDMSGPETLLVDQLSAHWLSPHRAWSVRLVLRYERHSAGESRRCQTANLVVEPRRFLGGTRPRVPRQPPG